MGRRGRGRALDGGELVVHGRGLLLLLGGGLVHRRAEGGKRTRRMEGNARVSCF